MELKVWVEGIQRIVCGVTETTTCQDVVFALAHATGKIGRFTLIERWRNNERLLAPNENPLKILMKWGEYSSDVQFILQRSDQQKSTPNADLSLKTSNEAQSLDSPKKVKSMESDQTIYTGKSSPVSQSNKNTIANQKPDPQKKDLIGIVRGIPHSPLNINKLTKSSSSPPASPSSSTTTDNTDSNISLPPKQTAQMSPILEFNSADVRNSLDRKTSGFREAINLSDESLQESYRNNNNNVNNNNSSNNNNSNIDSTSEMYKNGPPISSNGALAPPPYRNPPPPRASPPPINPQQSSFNTAYIHQNSDSQSSTNSTNGNNYSKHVQQSKYELVKEISPNVISNANGTQSTNIHINAINNLQAIVNNATTDSELMNDNHFQNAQYRELIQLIQYQRDKINIQQADITKYDAEIIYLESKERDQIQQLDAITREINKTDQLFRQSNDQLQTLQYVEEENELVRQQEKTLKSEITLLRSKLANCETELLQCKNKMRLLMDDIQIEQRSHHQFDGRQLELHFLHEVDRIQTEIDHAVRNSESSNKISDSLKNEVSVIENAIAEKKKQLEKLVNEMKEVNLQSLAVAPSEEIRHLLEGSHRPGSTRRIMGSPRQLETAVPTSKNPHGVWV